MFNNLNRAILILLYNRCSHDSPEYIFFLLKIILILIYNFAFNIIYYELFLIFAINYISILKYH